VWFCPFTNNLTGEELLELLADCAGRAERLRQWGAEVVFLTGSELSLMTAGILPGGTMVDRAALLAKPNRLSPLIPEVRARMNELLRKAVDVVRARLRGKLSYASVPLVGVDWGPFDIISTDAGYRTPAMAGRFREDIREFVAQGRRQENRWRSPSSAAPPSAALLTWPTVGILSSGTIPPGRFGSRANTRATRMTRPGTFGNCWMSS